MTTPLVLPPLEVEICGATANIYYFDWLKCLTALPRVFMTFVNPFRTKAAGVEIRPTR